MKGYDVFYDHGTPSKNVGNIVSTLEEKYGREDELSQLDIAIIEKSSDLRERAVVLVEIEETNDRPKTLLGDIFGFLFGEHVFFKGEELEIGDYTTLIVVGIGRDKHSNRNQHIQHYANKIKAGLGTNNSRIGKVIIQTYQRKNDLLSELPSDLKKAVEGEL